MARDSETPAERYNDIGAQMADAMADTIAERAERYARDLGRDHGRKAATWFDFADAQHARDVADVLAGRDLANDRNGTRAESIEQTFPRADLSGEWADTLTGPELVADAIADAGADADDIADPERDAVMTLGEALFSELCDAYEEGFAETSRGALFERAARYGDLAGGRVAYVIDARVAGRDVPTFYLLADVQGITSEEHARRVAIDVLYGARRPEDGATLAADQYVIGVSRTAL